MKNVAGGVNYTCNCLKIKCNSIYTAGVGETNGSANMCVFVRFLYECFPKCFPKKCPNVAMGKQNERKW